MMRGFVYSIVALLFVSLVLLLVFSNSRVEDAKSSSVQENVRSAKFASFIESMRLDLPRINEYTAKRAMVSILSKIDKDAGTPSANASAAFRFLAMNKSYLDGTLETDLMNLTLSDWATSVSAKGTLLGYTTNVSLQSFDVRPYDALTLNSTAVIYVSAREANGTMNFTKTIISTIFLPLNGVEDSLYTNGTYGFASRTFNSSFEGNGTEFIISMLAYGWYVGVDASMGPSFFDRLEGRNVTSAATIALVRATGSQRNDVGMLSLVPANALDATVQSLKGANASVRDSLYLSQGNLTNTGCFIAGVSSVPGYSWFRLDRQAALYWGIAPSDITGYCP